MTPRTDRRVLVLASRSPYPLTAGYRMRIHYLAKLLSARYAVDLLCLQPVALERSSPSPFSRVFEFPLSGVRLGWRALRGWAGGWPLQVGAYIDGQVSRWVREQAAGYEMVYVNHVRMAPYALGLGVPCILDYHDAISLHYRSARRWSAGFWRLFYAVEAERILRCELEFLSRFTGAVISSPVDRDYLVGQGGAPAGCRLEVLPMGVRDEVLALGAAPELANWIVFSGRMVYYPNRDAALFFARRVFPELWRRHRGLELYIVGADPPPDVRRLARLPGVHVTGYVPDPWAYVARARVVVAPIRMGAGIQNKVLEALALGRPVVATGLAVQGIEGGVSGRHFLVAETADEMVEAISGLLAREDEAVELGRHGRLLVLERYTWPSVGRRLYRILDNWLGPP